MKKKPFDPENKPQASLVYDPEKGTVTIMEDGIYQVGTEKKKLTKGTEINLKEKGWVGKEYEGGLINYEVKEEQE